MHDGRGGIYPAIVPNMNGSMWASLGRQRVKPVLNVIPQWDTQRCMPWTARGVDGVNYSVQLAGSLRDRFSSRGGAEAAHGCRDYAY